MSNWTFWEWVAYAVLFIAAVIIAADQGVKMSPVLLPKMAAFISNPYWAFAPLVLVIVGTLILVSHEFGWLTKRPQVSMEEVIGRAYENQVVVLDGHVFQDCTFNNVTFRWNGGPYQFLRAQISGVRRFETQNYASLETVELLNGLHLLDPEFAASWKRYGPDHFK